MTTLRYTALVSLGIAFCIGCGDSSTQSWEGGKSLASGQRKTAKVDPADKDDTATEAAQDPHKLSNPHGGMQMPEGESDAKLENTGKLDIGAVHLTVPKAWIAKAHNPMLQAEFAIPRTEGDKDDGRLTVSQAGGTLEDNVNRWKGQFSKNLDKENQETIDVGGTKVTLVDFSGTFDDSRGMMSAPVTRPDYRMLGAIFESDGRLNFVKSYGPSKTMAARADEIKGFIRSLKVDK